jgi:hypothetical protein
MQQSNQFPLRSSRESPGTEATHASPIFGFGGSRISNGERELELELHVVNAACQVITCRALKREKFMT